MKFDILSEYCFVNMGQSPASETYNNNADGLPFYQGNADFGEIHPQTRIWCSAPVKIANKGDLLISVRAPIGALNIATEQCCIGRGLAALTPKLDKCRIKYIYFAIQSQINFLIANGTGSTFKAVNKNTLENLLIPVSSLNKQDEIVKILEKVNNIINKRKAQLLLLDNIVKSRFIEQIGTIKDTKFKITELESLCEFIKDGTHQTPTYTDDKIHGFKFLSSKDVTTRKISWDKVKYITPDLHKQLYSVIAPKRGDILLAKNGTIGYAAVVDNDEIFDIYVSLALLRPKKENDVYYLWAAINNNETKAQFISSLKGIGVPNLHLREIKKTKIIVPPIDIQRKFSGFITQTDKSKLEIQKSLDKLEILKKSLMQQYFG